MLFRTPFFLPILYPQLTWRIPVTEKEIYLTFDDGPVPGPTEFVLEALEKYKAEATFFCIGDNVRKHPDVFRQVVSRGHAIGNHTYNHLKGWDYPVEDYLNNVALCDQEFLFNNRTQNIPGVVNGPRLFRPPYGRITRAQINAMKAYRIIMWDVLTHDYLRTLSPENCLRRSVRAVRQGSVVVFHDSLKAEKNLRYVLPRFLEHFATLGYSFKAIANA